MKNNLDEFHYHEVLDRLHVIMTNIDTHILDHAVMEEHATLKKSVEDSLDTLMDVYQKIGTHAP